jgi:hypothetical protein
MWSRYPGANIGVRPPAGIVVVDVDPRDSGAQHLCDLLAGRRLTPTLTAHTGGGGLHAWYACPGPYRRKLCPGVDLKPHDAYVIVPPSVHPDTGRRYTWANGLPVATAPTWLRKLIRKEPTPRVELSAVKTRGTTADSDRLARYVETMPEGGDGKCQGRNAALFWAACRLFADRLPAAEVRARLADAARTAGLPDSEIDRALASAESRAA